MDILVEKGTDHSEMVAFNNVDERNNGYEYVILYYGNILNPEEWKILQVPISAIKFLKPSNNGYGKIEVIWNDGEEYNIDMFNQIEFK